MTRFIYGTEEARVINYMHRTDIYSYVGNGYYLRSQWFLHYGTEALCQW